VSDRLIILAPALLGVAFALVAFAVYCVLCATGRAPKIDRIKHNQLFGHFVARYVLWVLGPIERALIGRVSANTVTFLSLLAFVVAGALVGTGHLASGAWIALLGGALDMLDGRLARAAATPSPGGPLVDSVADRWAELALFTGYAWYLHATPWFLAVMLAIAGSMMVSYTRARGEGLGIDLRGGIMQRAERVTLVSVGALVAAWFALSPATAGYAPIAVGLAHLACGVLSTFTALGRWVDGYRILEGKDAKPAPAPAPAPVLAPVDVRRLEEVRRERSGSRDVAVPTRQPSAVNQR
jgi:phosphatidylglycerophosphate synthase